MKRRLVFLSLFAICIAFLIGATSPNTTWRDFTAREGSAWTPHWNDQSAISSLYGKGTRAYNSPEDAARRILNDYAALFHMDAGADLRLESVSSDSIGRHYQYRQYSGGLPVVNALVSIHVNRENKIIAVNSGYQPDLSPPKAAINSAEQARQTAALFLRGRAVASTAKLMVLPMGHQGVAVWRIQVDSIDLTHGSWLLYVDAMHPDTALRALRVHATFEGKGNIWLQNPVVTPTRTNQTLLNMDDSKKLSGKFVTAFDANFIHDVPGNPLPADYTTASDPNRNFNFNDGDARLAEAMAYFHINRVHDQWLSFGFKALNAKAPAFVNVAEEDNGAGYDNAYYTRSQSPQFRKTGLFVFGAGNELENLGLDCDVYYHEYGHGVLDHVNPGLFEAYLSNYPGSFHEAFGDMSDAAITGNSKIGEWGLRLKKTKRFVGRNIQNTNHFPQNVIDPPLHQSEVHFTGLIAGGAWWDLTRTIGASTAQKILYASLKLMPIEMNFFDFKDAMLAADANMGGMNQQAIQDAFAKHGLGGVDPGQPGKFNITGLKTGRYDIDTGKITLQTSFLPGDVILVLANYNASNLTPGYNFVPVSFNYVPPPFGSKAGAFAIVGEAVNGAHNGIHGAPQGVIITTPRAAKGTYSLSIVSQLGGQSKSGAKQTAKFEIK